MKKNNSDNVDMNVAIGAEIVPQQTAVYNISIPLPLSFEMIDQLVDMNSKLKKSRITTLYTSLPSPLAEKVHQFFAVPRGINNSVTTLESYISILKYAQNKGFEVLYAMNATKTIEKGREMEIFGAIGFLLDVLQKNNITNIKISNPAIFEFVQNKFPNLDLYLSTTTEYHSVQMLDHVLRTYPKIKTVNIATEDNHNFDFIKSLRTLYPNVKIEVLVNEHMCVRYCMSRCFHPAGQKTGFPCKEFIKQNPYLHFCRTNTVHPWELEYYSAIGVNAFKFTTYPFPRACITDFNFVKYYLECIDNGVENYTANDVFEKIYFAYMEPAKLIFPKDYPLKEFIQHIPDIRYFIKNGSKCSSVCGTACTYCYEKAKELKQLAKLSPANLQGATLQWNTDLIGKLPYPTDMNALLNSASGANVQFQSNVPLQNNIPFQPSQSASKITVNQLHSSTLND